MRTLSLRTKIIYRLAIMSLCSMSVLLVIMHRYVSHSFRADLINRGRFLAHTIGDQSATPILTQKFLALGLMLADAKGLNKDLAYLFITDRTGHVIAHTFGDAFPTDLKKATHSDKKSLHRINMDGHDISDITSPILSGTLGTIHVGMSEDRINSELKKLFYIAATVIIVFFLTAAWLLWLSLERIIIRPIKNLEYTFNKAQETGLDEAVTVTSDDEIGQLGHSFNQMAEHLSVVDLQRTNVIAELNESNQALVQMISEREQAEARLAESEEKLRLILDSAGEGIFGIDAQGCCTFCNLASLRLLGYDNAQQLIGKNVHQHVHHSSQSGSSYPDKDCRIYKTFLDGERVHADDEMFWKADRTPFPVEYWSYPQIKDGKIIGTVVTFVDISQRKQAEEENKKLQHMLLQSQKLDAMGTLAGGIAHDFNNILAVICGYTEIARKRCGDNVKLADNLQQIMIASDRARELVKQILTFSRKSEICQQPLQLSPLIKETLKLIRSSIPATIEIKQQLDVDAVALADPTQIHQVVMNLCANAYHAMAKHGGILAVSLKKSQFRDALQTLGQGIPQGDYAVIEVSDTGCGMDEETRQKIFEPYFSTKGKGKGSGLGLAVVHGIVKSHGGKITVYSEPGAGSTFRVYLPLIAGPEKIEPTGNEKAVGAGNGELIVFVDDEQQIREMAREFLTEQGYLVELYSDGVHALAGIKDNPSACSLLVTDMAMPGMSGKDLAHEVLLLRPDLPIILCTGYSELINGESAKYAGIREYLQKPVPMKILCEKIRWLLDETAVQV